MTIYVEDEELEIDVQFRYWKEPIALLNPVPIPNCICLPCTLERDGYFMYPVEARYNYNFMLFFQLLEVGRRYWSVLDYKQVQLLAETIELDFNDALQFIRKQIDDRNEIIRNVQIAMDRDRAFVRKILSTQKHLMR